MTKVQPFIIPGILVALVGFCGVGFVAWTTRHAATQSSLDSLTNELASTSAALAQFKTVYLEEQKVREAKLLELSDGLYGAQQILADLSDTFEDVEGDVKKLSGSVDDLEKLTTTDPELLQKYSKIYFLNEHYVPADLEVIQEEYDYVNGKEATIHADVLPYLEDLLQEATEDGIKLFVLSGYRSYVEQSTLKDAYVVRYGSGANTFSADQGYSEHQLGTAVDFTDEATGEYLQGFEGTQAFTWLTNNAYKFGFVMSYPKNNEHYVYEPWHWRFVGKDLARYLHRNNKNLYDLEQRTIDTYLGSLFD
jgi:LAS superfamily LD-carboxypeptidase LdcB